MDRKERKLIKLSKALNDYSAEEIVRMNNNIALAGDFSKAVSSFKKAKDSEEKDRALSELIEALEALGEAIGWKDTYRLLPILWDRSI